MAGKVGMVLVVLCHIRGKGLGFKGEGMAGVVRGLWGSGKETVWHGKGDRF